MNPEKISDLMLLTEKVNHLFDLKVEDLQIYPYIRMPLYYMLVQSLGIYQTSSSNTSSIFNKINVINNAIKYRKTNQDKLKDNNNCILVVESPRKDPRIKKNIYFSHLLENIEKKYLAIRSSGANNRYSTIDIRDQNTVYFDVYRTFAKLNRPFYLNSLIYNQIRKVAETINNCFNIHLNMNGSLNKYVSQLIIHYYSLHKETKSLLKSLNPTLIILEESYGNPYFVDSAKDLHIPTIELQHGIIYDSHLGYSYPNTPKNTIKIFPDYLFTFGDYWQNRAAYPIEEKNIISVGFPHLEYIKKKKSNFHQKTNKVLFVSQNAISHLLIKTAIELATQMPKYEILYKLHPKQSKNDIKNNLPTNLLIIGADEQTIYELFNQCSFQVGVFSTAIYEGLAYGHLKTILCELPGHEFALDLFHNGDVQLASNATSIREIILNHKFKSINGNKYFKPNSIKTMISSINLILDENSKKSSCEL